MSEEKSKEMNVANIINKGIPKLLEQSILILLMAAIIYFLSVILTDYIDYLKSDGKALIEVIERNTKALEAKCPCWDKNTRDE